MRSWSLSSVILFSNLFSNLSICSYVLLHLHSHVPVIADCCCHAASCLLAARRTKHARALVHLQHCAQSLHCLLHLESSRGSAAAAASPRPTACQCAVPPHRRTIYHRRKRAPFQVPRPRSCRSSGDRHFCHPRRFCLQAGMSRSDPSSMTLSHPMS